MLSPWNHAWKMGQFLIKIGAGTPSPVEPAVDGLMIRGVSMEMLTNANWVFIMVDVAREKMSPWKGGQL